MYLETTLMVFLSRYMEPTRVPHIGYKLKAKFLSLAPKMKARSECYSLSSIYLPDYDQYKEAAIAEIEAVQPEEDRQYPGIVNNNL